MCASVFLAPVNQKHNKEINIERVTPFKQTLPFANQSIKISLKLNLILNSTALTLKSENVNK